MTITFVWQISLMARSSVKTTANHVFSEEAIDEERKAKLSCKIGSSFSLLFSSSFLPHLCRFVFRRVYVRSTYCALNIHDLDSPGDFSRRPVLSDISFLSLRSEMCRSRRCDSDSRRRTGWSRRKRRRQCRRNRSAIAWTLNWQKSRITWTSRIARSMFCSERWVPSFIYSTSSFLTEQFSFSRLCHQKASFTFILLSILNSFLYFYHFRANS